MRAWTPATNAPLVTLPSSLFDPCVSHAATITAKSKNLLSSSSSRAFMFSGTVSNISAISFIHWTPGNFAGGLESLYQKHLVRTAQSWHRAGASTSILSKVGSHQLSTIGLPSVGKLNLLHRAVRGSEPSALGMFHIRV